MSAGADGGMIDLHCHLLPGIDDGAPDLQVSLAMARIAVDDGIRVTACTPHIYPGLYENDREGIVGAVSRLQAILRDEGKPCTMESSMAKLQASRCATYCGKEAVQIHGGAGYTREFAVERYFRDARVTEIYEGTTEIQNLVIARGLLKT